MFNRKSFKRITLQNLKGRWKHPLLVSLVVVALVYVPTIPFANMYLDDSSSYYSWSLDFTGLLTLVSFAITGIISIAKSFYFLRFAANPNVGFSTFVEGLNLWLKGILASLWSTLWMVLWSLLFVIPGIIKFYAYSQIYFILADHPTMSVRKALELSKIMTRGYKGDLFFLDLSFLGWVLLSYLVGGLGFIILEPYHLGSRVAAYRFLKEQALSTGILKEADFSDTF